MNFKTGLLGLAVASALVSAASEASAVALTLDFNDETSKTSNSQHTGASGSVGFSFFDVTGGVKLTLDIANTTSGAFGAGATESILTGFGFDLFDGLELDASSFAPTGSLTTLIPNASASPYGFLDVAFADNDNFNGGNANKGTGLKEGTSTSLSFVLKSTTSIINAAILGDMFATSFASSNPIDAVLRFQSVNAGAGSDKLIYSGENVVPTPLPATLPLLLAAIGGLFFAARRRAA